MPKTDKRVDSYIDKSAAFAKPILKHIRKLVHKACPDVVESWKWSFPHFEYKGVLCSMASFKEHCAFGFWKASLMADPQGILKLNERAAMGQLGRITSLKDLPADKILTSYIKEAVRLNEEGKKTVKIKKEKEELVVPEYFMNNLKKNKKALAVFAAFSPSHKREYVEWITDAKSEDTKEQRMDTAIEWMAEGKADTGSTLRRIRN